MQDWNGREIKVGSIVRHAYEPASKGYHSHRFAGTAMVRSIMSSCCDVAIATRGGSTIYLGCLLEVVDTPHTTAPYIVPGAGPYREPVRT